MHISPQMLIFTAVFIGIAVGACGSSKPEPKTYSDKAQRAYDEAMEDFRDDDCMDAEPAFRQIRRKYAYSKYAALSELRLADCHFMNERFVEAISAYRQFVRNRPSHVEIPYARFKVAESHFEQIPEDWFLSPPAHEKDQGPTRDALKQLRRFILDFSEDPRVKQANQMVVEAVTMLGRHEFYVAEFYYKRDHYRAAIGRLQQLLNAYPGAEFEPDAILMLGRSFVEIGQRDRARDSFKRLLDEYPNTDAAADGRRELGRLGS